MNKNLTELTKGRYNRNAWLYDLYSSPLEPMAFSQGRKVLWGKVVGSDILEVGVGTGKNVPFYPEGKNITALDMSLKMLERAKKKSVALGKSARFLEMDVEHLEFPDNSFDTVVTTCVFSTVPNPIVGLREIRRVARPGGRLLMMEQMRSENPVVNFLFDLFNPVFVRVSGANINRETKKNLEKAGWVVRNEANLFSDFLKLIEALPNKA